MHILPFLFFSLSKRKVPTPFQKTTLRDFSHLFRNTSHFSLHTRIRGITTYIHLLLIQYEWSNIKNESCIGPNAQIYMSCILERKGMYFCVFSHTHP